MLGLMRSKCPVCVKSYENSYTLKFFTGGYGRDNDRKTDRSRVGAMA